MIRWLRLSLTVPLLLAGGLASASARGGMRSDDPWNPEHIDGLPAEVRGAIAHYARVCGGTLVAGHSFARYYQQGTVKLIGLHFEHLRCDRAAVCTAAGCLHQVYISSGGRYRLLISSYVPELDLTQVRIAPRR